MGARRPDRGWWDRRTRARSGSAASAGSARLWIRWSWRDLRQRWIQVAAIALILAIGTGIFAALTSTAVWRRASNDASFELARLHDLKIRLTDGTSTAEGSLLDLVRGIPDADAIDVAEERLVSPTQFEVPDGDRLVLVSGELVGGDPAARVDRTLLRDGTQPSNPDHGLLEYKFAIVRDLAVDGTLAISGGSTVDYTGRALSPEYFWLVGRTGIGIGQGNQATMFVGLERAQELAGLPGAVNDVVLTVAPGTDLESVRTQLQAALAAQGLGGSVTTGAEEPAYRLLYDDIDSDQEIWNLISALVLGGASFAAFNLVSRIVEAQRREIGIGMALGTPARLLAVRPMLVGAQIALLGVAGGIVVGLLFAEGMRSLMNHVVPLPVWHTALQPLRFAAAAGLGFALPFVATVIPVWRAVRVQPVDAIHTGRGATARRGWARLGAGMRWPRRSLHQYPIRNLLRVPRRTLLTVAAVAAALTVLIGVFGMLDSFERTIAVADAELTREAGERIDVQLASFEAVNGPTITAIAEDPTVGEVVPHVIVPAELRRPGREPLEVLVEILDFDRAPWTPSTNSGQPPGAATGIMLAEKALDDLGLTPGDVVTFHHPRRDGLGYTMVDTQITVAGSHLLPLRTYAFLDVSQADLLGLEGIANGAQVLPAAGVDREVTQRSLFGIPGVSSAIPVGETGEAWDEALAQYTGVLRMVQGATLALALLIAFNASSISVDERAREHATMFAFGVRRRGVLAMNVVESGVIGVLGTLGGIAGGYLVMWWIFGSLLPRTIPEVGIDAYLAPATAATLCLLGTVVVALAPLLNARRLRRMDIPATLRVVE
jgi:putative ABC transport system permease protein